MSKCSFTLIEGLNPDPESETHEYMPNKTMREVRSGHYVPVKPTPLSSPYLVGYSSGMASDLGLSTAGVLSEGFLRFFSGDIEGVDGALSWATPYALSIMGEEMVGKESPCPFKTGSISWIEC